MKKKLLCRFQNEPRKFTSKVSCFDRYKSTSQSLSLSNKFIIESDHLDSDKSLTPNKVTRRKKLHRKLLAVKGPDCSESDSKDTHKSSSSSHEFRHIDNMSNINISFCAENEEQCSSNKSVDKDNKINDDLSKAQSSYAFICNNESSDSDASAPLPQKCTTETHYSDNNNTDNSEDEKEYFSNASSGNDDIPKLIGTPKSELKTPPKMFECSEKP